jgi:HEPN domain-containing protein
MSERPEKTENLRGWVRKAESDFRNAEHTLKMDPEECPFDTVCFHAQQTVEKYLKALLAHLDVHFRKMHDLSELVALLPPPLKPPMDTMEQDVLTGYASTGRYPGLPDILGDPEARQAITIARRVRDWARSRLPTPVIEDQGKR